MGGGRSRWIWAGRGTFALVVAALIVYLAVSGLDRADKLASAIGVVVAVVALGAPYLRRPAPPADAERPADPRHGPPPGPARPLETGARQPLVVARSVRGLQIGNGNVMVMNRLPRLLALMINLPRRSRPPRAARPED
ncbi:hypothetical protein Ade02nite_57600 [Paractinoplanes deccanensis]|uniref:Uncharacterized protein n=1 Tax=Paractinoplanes deccanensis TaxID=113561 RepID=A0ABQ3YAT7_9ACTN|nr:hypothetical protein [Actinoplanes deccanensis]GID77119.1 hypothetical protein Ade02nite_57600 [Actinoplanes deccanensis]